MNSDELIGAYKELAFRHDTIEKCLAELRVVNQQLVQQIAEKEKRAAELDAVCAELRKTEEYLTEQVKGLEEMMYMTSHRVRQPITSILGISKLLEHSIGSQQELKELVDHLKESALSLDIFTRELTGMMAELEQKAKNKQGKAA